MTIQITKLYTRYILEAQMDTYTQKKIMLYMQKNV